MRKLLAFAALLCALRIIGIALPPLSDPSESRYALIVRAMARSGDFVTLRLQTVEGSIPFLGKPPLHFWLGALSVRVFGEHPFAYRLPSLAAALLCLLAVYRIGTRLVAAERARLAVAILASCGAFVVLSGYLLVDMTLTLFVALANLWRLELGYEEDPARRRRLGLQVGVALALAFLTKGPVGIIFFALPWIASFAVARRSDERFRSGLPLLWIALPFLLVATPWFVAAERDNPGFIRYFFVNENLQRYLRKDYGDRYGVGHVYPYGTALVMFFASALPWSFLALTSRRAERETGSPESTRAHSVFRHAKAAVALCVLFLCFMRQLLFTYLLPLLPLFALALAARGMKDPPRASRLAAGTALLLVLGCGAFHLLDARSTKDALADARVVARKRGLPKRICFPRKTPSSAFLHAEGTLELRAKDGWLERLEAELDAGTRRVYLLTPHDFEKLPEELKPRLEVVRKRRRWWIFLARG